MSREMDNHSFSDRNSLTGNSGLLGMTKTRLQPMRVQALLDLYNSDDEDSEDKGKDSDDESDCDDIEPLTDEEEEIEEPQDPITDENKPEESCNSQVDYVSKPKGTVAQSCSEQLEQKQRFADQHENFSVSEVRNSKSRIFADNFSSDEQSHRKVEISKVSTITSESVCAISQGCPSASAKDGENRRSNVKFEIPEIYVSDKSKYPLTHVKPEVIASHESNEKCKYAPLPVKCETIGHQSKLQSSRPNSAKYEASSLNEIPEKSYSRRCEKSDAIIYPSKVQVNRPSSSKFEAPEQSYYSQSEPHSSAASSLPTPGGGGHLITDTPLKNNPPLGSSRPTPSVSHRSMFQTPQSSKLHNQDYSKNHVQTPATIFGNWSQKHMAQTPLQNRTTTSDSSRSQVPSILVQHGSGHDTPWHRNSDDKDRPKRKPLGETIQSNPHSSEKASSYSSIESSAKTHESADNQSRGVLESIKDGSCKKSTVFGTHESKENRHPLPIEKSVVKEDQPRSRPSENSKELINAGSKGTLNEIRPEARPKVASIQTSESQAPQSFRSSYSSRPNPTPAAAPAAVEENKNVPERKANVQLSIPSSIRRPNHGETITVKTKEYLILGTLGAGMSGQVLRVQDLRSRELRAIKVVDLSKMDKDCAQGCLQEISMLYNLQAPCIVKMFDYEISYPMLHVVMEMGDTDFRSLLRSMSEKKKLPLTMILYYWTEMLTAVKHIHDNGVIHSDLKPANFLLVRGRLKLIDFGIASSMNPDMTSVVKNSPIGTINYISPEALMDIGGNGGDDSPNKVKYKITFKSDVWSLGCILYSLVYGHTPFEHIRVGWAKMHAITNPNPNISFTHPTASEVDPPPPVLIDVMRKCLQHDPKARPTVGQLLQIPYVPTKQNPTTPAADIPSSILLKIKHSLTDSEWRQFIDIMEAKRNQC